MPQREDALPQFFPSDDLAETLSQVLKNREGLFLEFCFDAVLA